MKKIDKEARDKYYEEVAVCLMRAGFTTKPQEDGLLPVEWGGAPLCRVTEDGSVRYREENVERGGGREALDRVIDIAATITEYMRWMETAPRIEATGLHEDYRLLVEYNGVALAGHKFTDAPGHQFVTWERSYDRHGVCVGHYIEDYAAAKQDFATRSGLVEKNHLFTDEQMAETYRCIHETLDSGCPITPEREQLLKDTAEQIERAIPDLGQRVELSNQKELIYGEQFLNVPRMG